MTVAKFIKPNKIIEYFDSQVRESLSERDLYSIEGYGWLNADDTDPEYDGYAKWHTSPKVAYDFDAYSNKKPFRIRPENIDIEMVSNGHDFMEVMKAAWLTLGQAIFFNEHSGDKTDLEFTYSSLALISAVIELNLAADRIRDYFVIAVLGRSPEKTNVNFTKFAEVVSKDVKNDVDLLSIVRKIATLSNNIYSNRSLRNQLTHELSSNNATFQRRLLQEQQRFHDSEAGGSGSEHGRESSDLNFEYLENNLEKTIACYRDLIAIGNLVFKYEYITRGRT